MSVTLFMPMGVSNVLALDSKVCAFAGVGMSAQNANPRAETKAESLALEQNKAFIVNLVVVSGPGFQALPIEQTELSYVHGNGVADRCVHGGHADRVDFADRGDCFLHAGVALLYRCIQARVGFKIE